MPLVRYRTGDLGRMIAEPCACGCLKPRLDKVEGRLDDSVRLSGGKVLSMHILDELLFALDEVEDFQASYNAAQKHLTVAVMKKAGYADAVGSRVKCQSSINGILWELPDRRSDRKRNFPLYRFGKKTAEHRGKMKNEW